jgi:hypothetical protein
MKYRHYPFKIKVSTLSPVHIGNGETLSSTGEYLTTSDAIYFLKHEDLMQKLQEEGRFETYLDKITEDKEHFDFFETLTNWSIDPLIFKERKVSLHQRGLNPASNNILHQHIKTAKQVYLPGSSLKGLFRHAIIANRIQKDQQLRKEIDTRINTMVNEGKSIYQIQQYWGRKEKEIADEKVFKAIQCADSSGLEDDALAIYQIQRQSVTGEITEGLDWLEECIAPQQNLNFILTYYLPEQIDAFGDGLFTSKLPQPLFQLLNDWTILVLQEELRQIQGSKLSQEDKSKIKSQLQKIIEEAQQAEDKYAIARIGKGKTIFFQTLFPLLTIPTQKGLADLISKSPTEVFPASRVLTVKDRLTKGWIKLEHQKPERNLTDNKIEGVFKQGMELQAYWVKKKTVEFMINGEHYTDIQLINKFHRFEAGEKITVVIHQLSKDNHIHQVKVKS